MNSIIVLVIAILILTVFMVFGVPMPMSFGSAVIWIILALGVNTATVCQAGYSSISSYVLLAIPLFTIGGALMSNSRIGSSIVDWFEHILGRIKACLMPVSACAFALFGAVSGSGMAVMSCLAPILFPRMKEKGYPPETVAAVMCCAAPLGLLIPPSVIQIMYAWSTNTSVLTCFLAIVVPGLTCTLLLSIVGRWLALKKNPDLPVADKLPPAEWGKSMLRTTKKSLLGLFMPIIVLGGIYSGLMTTTESAAVSAVYALFIAGVVYREVKLKPFIGFMANAGITSGVVMINVFFIMVFSRLLLQEGLPKYILNAMLAVSDKTWVIMLMINLFMIVLGMLMDDTCACLLVSTLLAPVVVKIGISPYQFAAIVGVNLGMGCITPPTAPFIYMSSRITGVPVKKMIKEIMIILLLVYLPVLVITTIWPGFSLWLPKLLLGDKFSMF